MKNIDYKKTVTGSLLALLILSTPVASFAKEKEKNDNEGRKERSEQKSESNHEKSWFGSNWFNSKNSKNIISAPVVSDLSITKTKDKKATIKWNTDLRSNSMVWYSTTPSIDTTKIPTIKRNNRTTKHKIELNRLEPNTVYYIVVGGSTNGGIGKSVETTFTTTEFSVNDTTAPVITGTTMNVGATSNTITWTTNEPSTSSIYYGSTAPIDTNNVATLKVIDASMVKNHSLTIPGLTSNTLYHFVIKSVDASNNATLSSSATFTTSN